MYNSKQPETFNLTLFFLALHAAQEMFNFSVSHIILLVISYDSNINEISAEIIQERSKHLLNN